MTKLALATSDEVDSENQETDDLASVEEENQPEEDSSGQQDQITSDDSEESDDEDSSTEKSFSTKDMNYLKEKWKLDSDEEVIKKIEHLESHASKLANENKELREVSDGVAESARRFKENKNKDLDPLKSSLDFIFDPVTKLSESKKLAVQDEIALNDFINHVPEAADFKEQLKEKGKRLPNLEYYEMWELLQDSFKAGIKTGATSEKLKSRASVGGSTGGEKTPSKPKFTPREVEIARRFNNDPAEVYGSKK